MTSRWSTFAEMGLLLAILLACKSGAKGPAKEKQLEVTGAGSALERVTSEDVSEGHPAISPDGTTLLFGVRTEDRGAPVKQTLVAVNPNTRAQRTLYTGETSRSETPCWLPDQSSYVYASDSPGSWSLVKALTASANAAVGVIASGEIAPSATWPTASPDGKRIAFSLLVRGVRQVAVVGVDGSHLTLLGEGETPAWSPDGLHLAFARHVGNASQLFVVSPDTGTDLVQLTTGEYDNWAPSWSPDGKYLVFSTSRGSNPGALRRNLFILARDGTDLTQLTSGDSFATEPNWGRDNWIYFSSDQAGNYDIWRLQPAGKYANLAAPPAPAVPDTAPAATASAPGSAKPTASAAPPAATHGGCMKDSDCKGDRICVKGDCTSPPAAAPAPAPAPAPSAAPKGH